MALPVLNKIADWIEGKNAAPEEAPSNTSSFGLAGGAFNQAGHATQHIPAVSTSSVSVPSAVSKNPTDLMQTIIKFLARISNQLNASLQMSQSRATADKEDFLERKKSGGSDSGGTSNKKITAAALGKAGFIASAALGGTALVAAHLEPLHKAAETVKEAVLGPIQTAFFAVAETLTKGRARSRELSLRQRAIKSGMSRQDLDQFMGQTSHESMGFTHLEERWNGKGAQARYEGSKRLGNNQIGDGFKYRGRGIIQLTGRANYARYGQLIHQDLVNHPELAAHPEISEQIAIAYWNDRVKRRHINTADTTAVTKAINGGTNGLAERIKLVNRYHKLTGTATLATSSSVMDDARSAISRGMSSVGGAISSAGSMIYGSQYKGKDAMYAHRVTSASQVNPYISQAAKYLQGVEHLKVVEQLGYGGIHAVHGGHGHYDGRAIDVDNPGGGAAILRSPVLKSKFDNLALRGQRAGFVALWNGMEYDPAGYKGGGIHPIAKGENQHKDHLHLEVPHTGFKGNIAALMTARNTSTPAIAVPPNNSTVVINNKGNNIKQQSTQMRPPVANPSAPKGTHEYRSYMRTGH